MDDVPCIIHVYDVSRLGAVGERAELEGSDFDSIHPPTYADRQSNLTATKKWGKKKESTKKLVSVLSREEAVHVE